MWKGPTMFYWTWKNKHCIQLLRGDRVVTYQTCLACKIFCRLIVFFFSNGLIKLFLIWPGITRLLWTSYMILEYLLWQHIKSSDHMKVFSWSQFLMHFYNLQNTCFSCNEGTLIFKVSRFGAGYFIGCDTHPKCK